MVSLNRISIDVFFMWNPGTVPQIHFEDVTDNFVYKLTRSPFSLTAAIVSDLTLTSLHWSPPELVGPIPNNTIAVHHDNITTTTFTSLKNASLGDSGNYTVTAVNECGQSSLQVDVEVLTGKLIGQWRAYAKGTTCTRRVFTHSYRAYI